jgi:predicted permease
MVEILTIILPIFLVVTAGFAAVRTNVVTLGAVDGMMSIILRFALPCLLFRELSRLDLAENFNAPLLLSFYTGAVACFCLGLVGARLLFGRPWRDAVAIGFAALFSNCLMLGVPISERAFGAETLGTNFTIISIHSPTCFLIGIAAMELARADGQGAGTAVRLIAREIVRNPLMIGIGLAFLVNLSGLAVPVPVMASVDLLAEAAIPAALFGLGGILTRCEPKRAFGEAAMVVVLSLLVHPLLVTALGTQIFDLPTEVLRNAVLTAAMPTGLIAYVFAQLYGAAPGAAASAVMFATVGSVASVPLWLMFLNALPG